MKIKIGFVSLGCPKNLTDTETMIGLLQGTGEIVTEPSDADIIIVNTCAFIESATQESIDTILEMAEYKQRGNLKKLIVTGCMAQRYCDDVLKQFPEVDAVVGTGSYHEIAQVVREVLRGQRSVHRGDIDMQTPESLPRVLATPSYSAYLKIADGCDNHCTYCIIPKLRGAYHSRSMKDILQEAQTLAAQGVSELNLIAQDTTRYGEALYGENRLPELLQKLEEIEGIHWIRLHYGYPERISDALIEEMARNKKVCKYIDMPLQHASDSVLKRMGRHITQQEAAELIRKLREKVPGIVIRSTFITGFPGETGEDFAQMKSFIQEMKFDRIGVFAYSQEEGTAAAQLPEQIEESVKEARRQEIMELQQDISLAINEGKIDRRIEVLCEGQLPSGKYLGRTQGDSPEIDGSVIFDADVTVPGEYVEILVTDATEYDLEGRTLYEEEKI